MALLAVSGVKLENRVNFSGKYDKENIVDEFKYGESSHSIKKAAAVPVVVLMSMNPSLLKAEAMNMYSEEALAPTIEVSVPESEYEKDVDARTYVMAPEYEAQASQQSNPPYGWAIFNSEKIRMSCPAKGNNKNYTLVYTAYKHDGSNVVRSVYLVQNGKKGSSRTTDHPAEVKELIIHDIGKGKEFAGVRTCENVIDETGKNDGIIWREIKLDDSSAQKIIDLLTNYSKWENKTNIKHSSTNSSDIIPPKHYH